MCEHHAHNRAQFIAGAGALFASAGLAPERVLAARAADPYRRRELWLMDGATGEQLRAYITMDGANLWYGDSRHAGYNEICWLLRDAHRNAEHGLSVQLLEAAWETQQVLYEWGYVEPIVVTSGFRTMETNSAVGGARYSYHLTGNAIDFYVPNTPMIRVWQAASSRAWTGGMGWYSTSHVHIDTGPRRYWSG